MNEQNNRRQVGARGKIWAHSTARWLSSRNITPNQISCASLVFGALSAGFLFMAGRSPQWWMWVCALICLLGRLLCNLFDGMVAVEGGKQTPSGEIFNDFPDRLSDPLILVATGYAVAYVPSAVILGWTAAIGALLTAYSRYLGAACGAGYNFCGPMAKQHRMFLLIVGGILEWINSYFNLLSPGHIFYFIIIIIEVGSLITTLRRLLHIICTLEKEG